MSRICRTIMFVSIAIVWIFQIAMWVVSDPQVDVILFAGWFVWFSIWLVSFISFCMAASLEKKKQGNGISLASIVALIADMVKSEACNSPDLPEYDPDKQKINGVPF